MPASEPRPAEEVEPGSVVLRALSASAGFLLAMVGAESRKRWVEGLAQWELRPSHFAALMVLNELGSISQHDLGRLIGIDPRNLVAVIDLLEQRELLERQPHPTDRRRNAVALRPQGKQLLRQIQRTGDALEREMLASLDETEQTTLRNLLLKLLPPVSRKGE